MKARPGTMLRYEVVKPLFNLIRPQEKVIYDIGGYDGYLSSKLKRLKPELRITVVDVDNEGLLLAQKRGVDTLEASILSLPINKGTADCVFALDLIEHIDEDFLAIKEISRILKKGGKLILTTPGEKGVVFPFISKEKSEEINKKWGHLRKGYSIKDLEKIFKKYRLRIIKKRLYFNFFTKAFYWLFFHSGLIIPFGRLFFSMVIKFENYTERKADEHLLVLEKY